MLEKPSDNEEEYFLRQEIEQKRKIAEERQAKVQVEQRQRERDLHFMKCPKCGMPLEEIAFGSVRIDKCFHCDGVWLDSGELDKILTKETGFLSRLQSIFRP